MNKEPTFKELLQHINSGSEESVTNCSIGLFVTEYSRDDNPEQEFGKEVDSFIVKKPFVKIESFVEDNELYYNVSFLFNSLNDSDYKQMWRFLCLFAQKARREAVQLQAGQELNCISGLSISIIPELYHGKYFAFISMPFTETFTSTENAFDKTAVISFLCNDESFAALISNDDMIDGRSVEREAELEIDKEFGLDGSTSSSSVTN